MVRYQISRKAVSLLLLVVVNLKFLKALHDANSSNDLIQFKHFSRDNHCGSAMAFTSTVAATQVHAEPRRSTWNCISKAISSKWRKSETNTSPPATKLTCEKKVQIRKQLEDNRETIMAMKEGYASLLQSFTELNKQISLQVTKRVKGTGLQTIRSNLRKLERYHEYTIGALVDNHICELGGIRRKLDEIESGSQHKARWHRFAGNLQEAFPRNFLCLGEVKLAKSSVEVPKKSPITQRGGNSLEKAEIRLGNSGESSHSTILGEMNPVEQNFNPLKHLTKKNINQPLTPSKVFSDPLMLIIDKANIGLVHDLRRILHCSFQLRPQSAVYHGRDLEIMFTQIKVGFERCVFQALAFLYKFKFITKVHIQNFFNSEDTLGVTARHLANLFLNVEPPLSAYHVLVPDMNFIINDWHTEHLKFLEALENEKKGALVHAILRWARNAQIGSLLAHATIDKFYFIQDGNLLKSIQNWSPKPWNSITKKPRNDPIRQNLEKMIRIFKHFPMYINDHNPRSKFVLNFHILNFFRTYGNENIKAFIKAYSNRDTIKDILLIIYGKEGANDLKNIKYEGDSFEKPFRLIKLGLELHQRANQKHDYEYFLAYPEQHLNMIPEQVSKKTLEELINEIEIIKGNYLETYTEVDGISENNSYLKTWREKRPVNEILEIFSDSLNEDKTKHNYNSWLGKIDPHVKILLSNENECQQLAHHLVKHYNVLESYPDISQVSKTKLYEFKESFVNKIQEEGGPVNEFKVNI